MDMSNDRNKYYEFLEFNKTSKEIIQNSATANNVGLFQTQEVKKIKLTKYSSFSNEILPEDKFKIYI